MSTKAKYEEIPFEELSNRAPSVNWFMGFPDTPEQAYAVLALTVKGWWVYEEVQSEQEAIDAREKYASPQLEVKIVLAKRTANTPVLKPVQRVQPIDPPYEEIVESIRAFYGDREFWGSLIYREALPNVSLNAIVDACNRAVAEGIMNDPYKNPQGNYSFVRDGAIIA